MDQPSCAGEHEALHLMNLALDHCECEIIEDVRLANNLQNIPQAYTFMVGGCSPGSSMASRLRGYILPDGTLELVGISHGPNIVVLKKPNTAEAQATPFMDTNLWLDTCKIMFGLRKDIHT